MTREELEQIKLLWSARSENDNRWYVYLYIDPIDKAVFYVGKGKENRVFDHLADRSEKEKTKRIEAIRSQGLEPEIDILADDLDEETSFRIESAVIDVIGKENLTNIQHGHFKQRCPIISSRRVREEAIIRHNVIVIIINKYFPKYFKNGVYNSSKVEDMNKLFAITRMMWKLNHNKIKDVQLIFSSYRGTILDVFEIDHSRFDGVINVGDAFEQSMFTLAGDGKYYFEDDIHRSMEMKDIEGTRKNRSILFGKIADEEVRNLYKNRYLKTESKGNPIKYFYTD